MIVKFFRKYNNQKRLIRLLWNDSFTQRGQSWIRGICRTCKNEILDESYLRDSDLSPRCLRCKTKKAAPETMLWCWDCFGYEYGLDAYEYITNNFVIE
jgi:hypothetical protein